MSKFSRKIVLNSIRGYSDEHDSFLEELIQDGVELFCTVGKDSELWHDVMDELIVGDGSEDRDTDMITTWHEGETLEDIVRFAQYFDIDDVEDSTVQIIEI